MAQDEQNRVAQKEEDARRVWRDKDTEEQRKEAKKKKPKLGDFDPSLPVRKVDHRAEALFLRHPQRRQPRISRARLFHFEANIGCRDLASDTNSPHL